jgi:hypothetical protein
MTFGSGQHKCPTCSAALLIVMTRYWTPAALVCPRHGVKWIADSSDVGAAA